jgi:predicted GNAT family acetyltransferase
MSIDVRDNTGTHRFEAELEGQTAFSAYRLEGRRLTLLHTEVPPEFEGKGVGSALAKFAFEHAKANNLEVTPRCPFMAKWSQRHPEYAGLIRAE